jgi:peptide/nickel transport system permease protein
VLSFALRRIVILIPFLVGISIVSFVVIQLPPGSYADSYVNNLKLQGNTVSAQQEADIRALYGLDKSLPAQYLLWISKIVLHGDFGSSFRYNRPVADILIERVPGTIMMSLAAIAFTWLLAVPLGILSAVRQYSVWDHTLTLLSLIGLAVPGFLLALGIMFFVYLSTGWLVNGFFSPPFRDATWSLAKIGDLLRNVWLPILVLTIGGMAPITRILRATLLDELNKQYVTTARAKGLKESANVLRYPLRIAINPLLSTLGWMLPAIVGGEIVVSKVLNLPTIGPILLEASITQDMYLAGAIVLILSVLTVVGTFISDILLALNDPRIRME